MLDDFTIHVKARISALWASATLCYLYGDVIAFYNPGALQMMMNGKMGPWPTTQGLLLGISVLMAFPAAMVVLSLVLRAPVSRWLNLVAGVLYTAVMVITMVGASGVYFYLYLGVVEVTLTSLIVWYAFTWPKQRVAGVGDLGTMVRHA